MYTGLLGGNGQGKGEGGARGGDGVGAGEEGMQNERVRKRESDFGRIPELFMTRETKSKKIYSLH